METGTPGPDATEAIARDAQSSGRRGPALMGGGDLGTEAPSDPGDSTQLLGLWSAAASLTRLPVNEQIAASG